MLKFKSLLKTTFTPIALCLTLTFATPAMAQKGHHQKHDAIRQILSELSLTDPQKQDIRQILKQSRADRDLISTDAKSLKTELRSLVQSTEWDQTAIENAITLRQPLIQEKALQRATNKNQVWNLLTNTQRAEFFAKLEQRKAERIVKDEKGRKKGKRKGNRLKRLNLTEAQLAAVEVIRTSAKISAEETKAKLKNYKHAERALVQSTDFNGAAWQTLSNQYQADFLAMAVLKAKTKHDIWNQLSPEQQAKAREEEKNNKRSHGKKGET